MARPVAQPRSRRQRRAALRARHADTVRARNVPWRSPVVLTTLGAVIVGVAIIAVAAGFRLGSAPRPLAAPTTSYAGLPVHGTTVGAASAPVVMQIYSDFQCPICERFLTTELPGLLRDFVTPGTLRIESHDIDVVDRAGGRESLELAIGGACATDQDAYWPYHDLVFWNQGPENSGYHDSAFIDRVAVAAGLDQARFDSCRARSDVRQGVLTATSTALAAGIDATPTIVVNDRRFTGLPDYGQLSSSIRQLAAAAS
ncbi:MAG TPA: thioredoxin domain-containing protein [Candidatus Limnocylindrales bacterium]|nr:thioredoxin domain-containing protein [Candidatus Limnocylindrales bacterium]